MSLKHLKGGVWKLEEKSFPLSVFPRTGGLILGVYIANYTMMMSSQCNLQSKPYYMTAFCAVYCIYNDFVLISTQPL